ncbi:hypothetical protein GZ77_14345 [Endozoicomonas montiporae]|uniref:Uncharacterized protein n=1 Tax=Endozoicomonas montiporae TaxID=1027273 RepID=A0A081N4Z0_9GAMM|nr:hypothetical protein [Endozoicomonas montiporae]KEQ13513.1 hypothetical protein GZ77_14345 [Endozoicomonas montiporae]
MALTKAVEVAVGVIAATAVDFRAAAEGRDAANKGDDAICTVVDGFSALFPREGRWVVVFFGE